MREETADELVRSWNEPTTVTCQRLSRDTETRAQDPQLDEWESEGGATAPRESAAVR